MFADDRDRRAAAALAFPPFTKAFAMMNAFLDRGPKLRTLVLAVSAAGLVMLATGVVRAGSILASGDLLTVSADRSLRSYTFDASLQRTLAITGLPSALQPTATFEGVSVIGERLFVGLISTIGAFTPKFVEVDPVTGVVTQVRETASSNLTSLGDDGTNILLINSVNTLQVYTYTPDGVLVSQVPMERHVPLNFQVDGLSGDGQSVFMSAHLAPQPILTNDAATGDNLSFFDTGMQPLTSFIGGLAYHRHDDTLWVAGAGEFRQFSRTGTLLTVVNTGTGNTAVSGLAIIAAPPPSVIPEPSSLLLFSVGCLVFAGGSAVSYRRARRAADAPGNKRTSWNGMTSIRNEGHSVDGPRQG